jgi:hypothetical protein
MYPCSVQIDVDVGTAYKRFAWLDNDFVGWGSSLHWKNLPLASERVAIYTTHQLCKQERRREHTWRSVSLSGSTLFGMFTVGSVDGP